MSPREVDNLVEVLRRRFPSFGGGDDRRAAFNPIAMALKDKPAMFAAGVDIRDVVNFVLSYDTTRTDGDPE